MADFCQVNGNTHGVTVTYIKSRKVVSISGWYDHTLHFEPQELPLDLFLAAIKAPESVISAAKVAK